MKKLQWSKLPPPALRRTDSIWSKVIAIDGPNPDFKEQEELFKQKVIEKKDTSKTEKKAPKEVCISDFLIWFLIRILVRVDIVLNRIFLSLSEVLLFCLIELYYAILCQGRKLANNFALLLISFGIFDPVN